jgi:membrane-bound inhibitor of C-type lysozyme
MIDAGLAGSSVCIGALDPTWIEDLKEVINDEGAMYRIGRLIWWGEGI